VDRRSGQLRFAIHFPVIIRILRGELSAAARFFEEDRLIAEVTGFPPRVYRDDAHGLARLGARSAELIQETAREATERGLGMLVNFTDIVSSVLHNGLGQHEAARDAAWRAFGHDHFGFRIPRSARAGRGSGQDR
jgi:hypothetical protein